MSGLRQSRLHSEYLNSEYLNSGVRVVSTLTKTYVAHLYLPFLDPLPFTPIFKRNMLLFTLISIIFPQGTPYRAH